jgi:hypothetical protein
MNWISNIIQNCVAECTFLALITCPNRRPTLWQQGHCLPNAVYSNWPAGVGASCSSEMSVHLYQTARPSHSIRQQSSVWHILFLLILSSFLSLTHSCKKRFLHWVYLHCSGLLSGHILAEYLQQRAGIMRWYRGELLQMARDLGYRLLPAFNTTTGIPHARVSLSHFETYKVFRWRSCI